jgi:acyl-CoA hydrolase
VCSSDLIVRRRVYEDEADQRRANAGDAPQAGGTVMQGAFLLGPADFYERLRELNDEQLALIDMTSVAEVNRIYTHYTLEHLQRRAARFINITMKVTLLGAAVSDQLRDGQVVSGVGGQHEFVSMAHQLPDGRSVLLLQATRGNGAKLESNIIWEYPHTTIPRHQRDIFISEYGVADLRGKTDEECIEALLAIADSRFQQPLIERAQRAGKLRKGFRLPESQRDNSPERIAAALQPYQKSSALPLLPFGCDLNQRELALAGRLRKLQSATTDWEGRAKLLRALALPASEADPEVSEALEHLGLAAPANLREHQLARLVRAAYRL